MYRIVIKNYAGRMVMETIDFYNEFNEEEIKKISKYVNKIINNRTKR